MLGLLQAKLLHSLNCLSDSNYFFFIQCSSAFPRFPCGTPVWREILIITSNNSFLLPPASPCNFLNISKPNIYVLQGDLNTELTNSHSIRKNGGACIFLDCFHYSETRRFKLLLARFQIKSRARHIRERGVRGVALCHSRSEIESESRKFVL